MKGVLYKYIKNPGIQVQHIHICEISLKYCFEICRLKCFLRRIFCKYVYLNLAPPSIFLAFYAREHYHFDIFPMVVWYVIKPFKGNKVLRLRFIWQKASSTSTMCICWLFTYPMILYGTFNFILKWIYRLSCPLQNTAWGENL